MNIKNLLINQQRFVLIVDEIGKESRLHQIVYKLVTQSQVLVIEIPEPVLVDSENDFSTINQPRDIHLPTFAEKCNVVFTPISKVLVLGHEVATIFQTLHKLMKNVNVKQVFAVATVKNLPQPFIVPYLEHMADLVVTFLDNSHLRILTKKMGGLVTNKLYNYQATDGEIFVKETVKPVIQKTEEPTIDPETLGTFKIGQLGKEELLAKNALQLPYEKINKSSGDTVKESKVIYVPDADDDLDPEEEDPDDDLYI